MVADEGDPFLEYGSAAASIAVLAGIAAADAVCCQSLGRRSRSDNHRDAEQLLVEVAPGGKTAASHLRKLLNVKDSAHYGFITLSAPELKRSLRQAEQLVGFAERVVGGGVVGNCRRLQTKHCARIDRVDRQVQGGFSMEDAMERSFTRVENKIARVEEQLYRCCSGAEEGFLELRNEIDASLNGWVKTIVLGAVIVTSIAVTRGR